MRPPYIFFQDYRVGLKLAMCEVHGLMVHAIGTGPETLFVVFFHVCSTFTQFNQSWNS